MSLIGFLFVLVNGVLLLALPRRWAPLPLICGGLFMTAGQVVEIGPCHFTVLRLLIVIGFVRTLSRGERIAGGVHLIDKLMLAWGAWGVMSSVFHSPFSNALVFRLGYVYECLGTYWLLRILMQNLEDVLWVTKSLLLLLIPLALEMLREKYTDRNIFSALGGILEYPEIRSGRVRAQGPFAHSILAGTAGAVMMPLAFLFWNRNRKLALSGLGITAMIIYTSASSGPLLTGLGALGALLLWKVRSTLRWIRWVVVAMIFALNVVMNDPVYFLIARIDLAGGSTGYYRAALIDAAIKHWGEWWLAGTDYTRHWMATGIPSNPNSADIVNHFIAMGVLGGLPLMLLFIGVLLAGFRVVSNALVQDSSPERQFQMWTLGAALFGHISAFLSVSYFDQTLLFLYLLLASIGSVQVQEATSVIAPRLTEEAVSPLEEDNDSHVSPSFAE